MSFKDKLEQFLKNAEPVWHISYDKESFRLKGLHPKNPGTDPNRIPLPYIAVKVLDEDELYMVEEIQAQGVFNYEVDPTTLKVKLREKQLDSKSDSNYGNFVRIEFSPSLDLPNLDVGISFLLEQKSLRIELLSKSAKDECSKLISMDEGYKIRLYITEYNNPNRLIDTFIVPLTEFSDDVFTGFYDASQLPEDVSIYYNKIFDRINFEVK